MTMKKTIGIKRNSIIIIIGILLSACTQKEMLLNKRVA